MLTTASAEMLSGIRLLIFISFPTFFVPTFARWDVGQGLILESVGLLAVYLRTVSETDLLAFSFGVDESFTFTLTV